MTTQQVELPTVNEYGFYEIRMESIGGQGANLAGKVLGEAGVLHMGLNGSNFSSYGSEKRGSPIKAFARFCKADQEVYVNSPVAEPHMLVIFHENLAKTIPVMQGVTSKTTVIINTSKSHDEARDLLKMHAGTLVCIDALKIAVEEKTRVNTALLGTISRFSGFLTPKALKDSITSSLGKKYASMIPPNLKTFDRGYEEGKAVEIKDDGKYPYIPFSRGEGQKIGYMNQPMGGIIPVAGTNAAKDLSTSREGWVPLLNKVKCTDCGECDITCPDFCFQWEDGTNAKGKQARVLININYQHCKGCLRCVAICKFGALSRHKETDMDAETLAKGFTRIEE